MNIAQLAQKFACQFQTKIRDNEEKSVYLCLADDAAQEVKDLVYIIHENGDIVPDDYKYQFIVDALHLLKEAEEPEFFAEEDLEELEERLEADTSIHQLFSWASSHACRQQYLDNSLELQPNNFFNLLSYAQLSEKREVLRLVFNYLDILLTTENAPAGIDE